MVVGDESLPPREDRTVTDDGAAATVRLNTPRTSVPSRTPSSPNTWRVGWLKTSDEVATTDRR